MFFVAAKQQKPISVYLTVKLIFHTLNFFLQSAKNILLTKTETIKSVYVECFFCGLLLKLHMSHIDTFLYSFLPQRFFSMWLNNFCMF